MAAKPALESHPLVLSNPPPPPPFPPLRRVCAQGAVARTRRLIAFVSVRAHVRQTRVGSFLSFLRSSCRCDGL